MHDLTGEVLGQICHQMSQMDPFQANPVPYTALIRYV
jgi:hypothetical protein